MGNIHNLERTREKDMIIHLDLQPEEKATRGEAVRDNKGKEKEAMRDTRTKR